MQERKPGSSINFKYKYRINALFYQKNPAWIRKVEGCIFSVLTLSLERIIIK